MVHAGARQRVTVQADSYWNARQMLEPPYGREAIVSGPHRLDSKGVTRCPKTASAADRAALEAYELEREHKR
jgi:hypothetical protein